MKSLKKKKKNCKTPLSRSAITRHKDCQLSKTIIKLSKIAKDWRASMCSHLSVIVLGAPAQVSHFQHQIGLGGRGGEKGSAWARLEGAHRIHFAVHLLFHFLKLKDNLINIEVFQIKFSWKYSPSKKKKNK